MRERKIPYIHVSVLTYALLIILYSKLEVQEIKEITKHKAGEKRTEVQNISMDVII